MLSISIDDLVGNGWKRCQRRLQQGGTTTKKRIVSYNHECTYQCILDDYLSRGRFEFIMQELTKDDPFWTNSMDCCGRMGNHSKTKILTALKTVSYGVAFSAFQSYFQMGDSTACLCVSKFCGGIFNNKNICDTYLWSMTKADARRISKMHSEKHGINGMLGFHDCMQIFLGKIIHPNKKVSILGKTKSLHWHSRQ